MPDPILPDLRDSLVRAAARRSRTPLVAAVCALLLVAAGATAALRAGQDDDAAVGDAEGGAFAIFERPAGPYDRLPTPDARRVLAHLHGNPKPAVRRIVLWGGQVGFVSRGGGRLCLWAGLGSGCASERQAERRGLVAGDPARIYTPEGRTVVAGLMPDRVLRIHLQGVRKDRDPSRGVFLDEDVARLRIRDNTFRANVPGEREVRAYTLVEADDADQWKLAVSSRSSPRVAGTTLRDCPKPFAVGGAWQVAGVSCAYVGEYIARHFEPHPPPYTIDKDGFACHVPRQKPTNEGERVSCTDGYRRFAFRFA
jgi:hypothetical protein